MTTHLHPVITGTVALWQLQSDLTDSSGNGYDAAMDTGTAAYTAINADINGFNFNRAGSIDIIAPAVAALRITGDLTIEFLAFNHGSNAQDYVDCLAGGTPATSLYTWGYSSSNVHYYRDNANPIQNFTGSNILGDGSLHHYALRRQGLRVDMFIDGAKQSTEIILASSPTSAGTERLRMGGVGAGYAGYLASFRVMGSARSDADIYADYLYCMGLTAPVGHTTSSYITDFALHDPFYYLKITGLPYYFFSTIDPTNAKWGTAQWTLGTGYTAIQGMDIPATDFDQRLNDIIGGIATAERIRLSMMDFNVVDTNGAHSFFGRMLSPGRTAASSTATLGYLNQDFGTDVITGAMYVHGSGGAFTAVDTYIGGETLGVSGVSGPDGSGIYTLSVSARNKYPCTSTYPARPYYHVVKDALGNVDNSQIALVTQGDPISFIGRSAALYIGHMKPDGTPEPETNALCRFVGHIRGINYGQEPGKFEFDIESVMADIKDSIIAPRLAHGSMTGGIYLPDEYWRTMVITVAASDTTHNPSFTFKITVPNSEPYDDAKALAAAIQAQFNAHGQDIMILGAHTYTFSYGCSIGAGSGGSTQTGGTFIITVTGLGSVSNITGYATLSYPSVTNAVSSGAQSNPGIGLLTALGWTPDLSGLALSSPVSDGTHADTMSFTAPRPAPGLFVPTSNQNGGILLLLHPESDVVNDRFFSDQGDGSGVGWVRLGDGQVVKVLSHSATSITIGEPTTLRSGLTIRTLGSGAAYYVEAGGSDGTFDQVLHIPSPKTGSGELALFQLLASDANSPDGEFNVFPEGCGLALDGLLDKDSIRKASFSFTTSYAFDVDRTTTFGELWTGISKTLGVFLVWDPTTATISLRQLQLSNPALASTFIFSESNRAMTGDRSKVAIDQSNLRTGWTVRYGWDYQQRKFTAPELHIVDSYAVSASQIASRTEVIEDRLLSAATTQLAEYAGALSGQRSVFTRYPWAKITRSVNKTGMLLSPGLYCQVVDNTIFNPFTGLQGVTAADGIYGFITAVRSNLRDGSVEVSFLVDQTMNDMRPWSPTGLLNFAGASNGYVTATGVCSMSSWYTQGDHDGVDFVVGDKVALVPRCNRPGAPIYEKKGTVTAVAIDGTTVTIDAGLGAVSTSVETIMILQDYGSQTTARKTTAATRVSFQGDGVALLIAGAARLEKWT